LIVRRFCFWRSINLFVNDKDVSEQSCDTCYVLLSYVMTSRTTTLYTCLVFLKQTSQMKIINLISHFSLMSSCTLNTRTIVVDFLMTFFTLIVIFMSNRLWFFVKCNNSYFVDAKRASCRRVYSSQITCVFSNVLQLLVMFMSYVKMLISFTKFMTVILYLNRSKIFKMFSL
jgi:hypothetical protein